MTLRHRLLAWSHPLIRVAKAIGGPLGLTSGDRLRVLLYHDIAPTEETQFASQLRWLSRTWTFIDPERFAAMMTGAEPVRGSNLLLTFDDGMASNRVIAEQVLNSMGVRALFFIVSDFVSLEQPEEARDFIARHIWPGTRAKDLPPHWLNMRWTDLEALLEQGHCIGGHTRTHVRLSQISSDAELQQEIIGSAEELERRLGVPIDHFAYTFGDLGSFSKAALAVARRRFRFVYSGLRGDNSRAVSPLAIGRDGANAHDSKALLGAFLEGAADMYYAARRAQLESWVLGK